MKEKFCNLYSEKTKDRIINSSFLRNVSPAFRLIRHTPDEPIRKEDFFPRVMEYNNNVMPPYEKQDLKSKISNFGVSVFISEDDLNNYTNLVPSERNVAHFIAKGRINPSYGLASETDERGHVDYYLFDPVNMNCYEDFHKLD